MKNVAFCVSKCLSVIILATMYMTITNLPKTRSSELITRQKKWILCFFVKYFHVWTEIRKNCENDIGTIYLSPLPCLTNRNAKIVAFVTYKIL